MTYENLVVERDDAVALVTVTRPAVLNALNMATLDEIQHAVEDLTADAAVRVVILTGAGDKAFVAGADISELAALTPTTAHATARRGQTICHALEQMGKPVIAAINGYALGGGCEIAMACTLRIAADTAKIGQPEISLGLIPGYGGTQRLSRLVGSGRALDIMLTGEPITAAEAHRLGLVNRVTLAGELMTEARALADALAAKAPIAMRYILEAVRGGLGMTLADGCEHEATLFGLAAETDDWREGTLAFLEKRRPRFTGS